MTLLENQGSLYLAVSQAGEAGGCFSGPPKVDSVGARYSGNGGDWEFLNGGDRLRKPNGMTLVLSTPLLVYKGELYIAIADARVVFDLEAAGRIDRVIQDSASRLQLRSRYRTHTIEGLTLANRPLRLLHAVQARTSLQPHDPPALLEPETILLCRRTVSIDGECQWLLTNCGDPPASYLVSEAEMDGTFEAASIAGTVWEERMRWFRSEATRGRGLRRSEAPDLIKTMAVTADMCWSLRPMERRLFDLARSSASEGSGGAITVFMCGRWLEQHPDDMEYLMDLEAAGLDIIWGLHSWVHPKSLGFMNEFSQLEVVSDTLRLEQEMLAWGIVPIVSYRFPGLIHDPQRLGTILDMNLLPIDADAWIAAQGSGHEYGGPLVHGSIVLLHGNGNEPKGIDQFVDWVKANPGWVWADISRFLPR
jgi:hypothetical protein